MKYIAWNVRLLICLGFLALPLSLVYAQAGCCSHHGGVSGCNTATNKAMCKDGTVSPSCPCSGSSTTTTTTTPKATTKSTTTTTTTAPKATTKSTPSTTTTTTTTTTKPKATTKPAPATTTKSTTKTAPAAATSTKGCCSGHGGVASCNKKTGFQKCKDGSMSTTCKCQ